jgi:hypothetical protein
MADAKVITYVLFAFVIGIILSLMYVKYSQDNIFCNGSQETFLVNGTNIVDPNYLGSPITDVGVELGKIPCSTRTFYKTMPVDADLVLSGDVIRLNENIRHLLNKPRSRVYIYSFDKNRWFRVTVMRPDRFGIVIDALHGTKLYDPKNGTVLLAIFTNCK